MKHGFSSAYPYRVLLGDGDESGTLKYVPATFSEKRVRRVCILGTSWGRMVCNLRTNNNPILLLWLISKRSVKVCNLARLNNPFTQLPD